MAIAMEADNGGSGDGTYTWMIMEGKAQCYTSTESHCFVHKLWEVVEAKPFHDETLIEATKAINGLLESAAAKSPDEERQLCFFEFQSRPLLAWSKHEHGGVTAHDDPATVARSLGLKYDAPSSGTAAKPAPPAPPSPKPKPSWNYFWIQKPDRLDCYPGGNSQTVTSKLWEADAPTEIHDRVLMDVTEEINRLLGEASEKCPHEEWELGLIKFQSRYMLAWTRPILGGIGPDADPRDVMRALHLRY